MGKGICEEGTIPQIIQFSLKVLSHIQNGTGFSLYYITTF